MADRELVPVDHIPLAPPRAGHEGEEIYLRLWQAWATSPANAEALHYMFVHTPYFGELTQRMASVAASFIVWQGTNCGYSMRHRATSIAEGTSLSWEHACLAALAIDNRRSVGVNCTIRVMEAVLAPAHPITEQCGRRDVDWALVPTITLEDMDVVECLFIWMMCEPAGRALVSKAEALINEARKRRSDRMRSELDARNAAARAGEVPRG